MAHEHQTELQELYNAFGYVLTEGRAILDAAPAHIDLEAFRFHLQRLGFHTANDTQPDSEDDLRNRDVLTEIDGELRATLYGVLAFARDPQRYARTRNFRIECVAYAGDEGVAVTNGLLARDRDECEARTDGVGRGCDEVEPMRRKTPSRC